MEVFTAASHHHVLALVTQIAVLLITARTLGEVAQRLGQPSVLGEIMAGILLGPSFLTKIFPVLAGVIIPVESTQGYLLEAVSMIGAMFLMLITGLETDLHLIRRHARTAVSVSVFGIIVTFSMGFLLAQFLPDRLLVNANNRLGFSLFLATTMSIAAISVIAKVLIDMKLMRRDIGQTILAAAMTDDTIAWVLVSIVAGFATGKTVQVTDVIFSAASVFVFIIFSFTLGQWFVKRALDFVQDEIRSRDRLLTLVVAMTFAWGAMTQALHLEPVLGAFVMGILFGQMPRLPHMVHEKLESIALGIFAPIFFAVAGLKVDLLSLFTPSLLLIAGAVILVASSGKLIGTYIGGRFVAKRDHWTALSFGPALNARGGMDIIIATIGLSLGLLSQQMFSIMVLTAMTTSLFAPTALRWVLARVRPEEQELKRLKEEELSEESPIMNVHRVLVPVRRWRDEQKTDAIQNMKFTLLKQIAKKRMEKKAKLSITLLSASQPGSKQDDRKFLEELGKQFENQEIVKKALEGNSPSNVILDEVQKDYDLLILGASQKREGSEALFSTIIDDLVRLSPCTTLVTHVSTLPPEWKPRRILVPTNGSLASKRAAEFAFLIASESHFVFLLKVLVKDQNWQSETDPDAFNRQLAISHQMVRQMEEMGESQNVRVSGSVEIGKNPEDEILEMAEREAIDLIILGTDVRPASERLFLGPRIERILKNAPCPVVVLNSI